MPRDIAPPEIVALAEARAAARRARDWTTADNLLAEIQAAGWRVVDSGTMYDLARMAPPDVVEGDVVRYGSSLSVPTRFDEAPTGVASVILVATDWPDDLARAMGAIAAHAPAATQVVVVANDPSDAQAAALAGVEAQGTDDAAAPAAGIEVVWTATRLGWAAALNAGIRRAAAPVVILLDTSVELLDDLVTELASTLEDPTVAVTGPFGLVSTDMRRFEDAPEGSGDVDAIEGYAMAFRRSDYVTRGPLDEHFVFYRNLDIWWSLVLTGSGRERGRRCASAAGGPRAVALGVEARSPWLDQPAGRGAEQGVEEELLPRPEAVRGPARPARGGSDAGLALVRRSAHNEHRPRSLSRQRPRNRSSFPRRCGTARPHFLPAASARDVGRGGPRCSSAGLNAGRPYTPAVRRRFRLVAISAGFAGGCNALSARPGLGE